MDNKVHGHSDFWPSIAGIGLIAWALWQIYPGSGTPAALPALVVGLIHGLLYAVYFLLRQRARFGKSMSLAVGTALSPIPLSIVSLWSGTIARVFGVYVLGWLVVGLIGYALNEIRRQ